MEQLSNIKKLNKSEKHLFKGLPYTLEAFVRETGISRYHVRKLQLKGWSLDKIAKSLQKENSGGFTDSAYFPVKAPAEKTPLALSFHGRPVSLQSFCQKYSFPEDVVSIMVENGLVLDEIYSCWNLWQQLGVIQEWKDLAERRSQPAEKLECFIAVEETKASSSVSLNERDRLKLIMSQPVDPKKCGAFYRMENYHFRPNQEVDY